MVPIKFAAEIRRVIINEPLRLKLKKKFLADIPKTAADQQLSETFCFMKISYVLTELLIFFYLE